ncbi:MAG: hypothetical protein JWP78_2905 [Mucilaginibacter sp.]|nr:hypothetical protein [Mucilaginibacter sp.]
MRYLTHRSAFGVKRVEIRFPLSGLPARAMGAKQSQPRPTLRFARLPQTHCYNLHDTFKLLTSPCQLIFILSYEQTTLCKNISNNHSCIIIQ